MKRYKVREVIAILKKNGWYKARTKGDHRQFKNNKKSGSKDILEMKQSSDISKWKHPLG